MTVAHRTSKHVFHFLKPSIASRLIAATSLALIALNLGACGRQSPMGDEQVKAALRNDGNPKAVQSALADLGSRSAQGKSLETWAPELVRLSKSPDVNVRRTVAELMGKEPARKEFRAVLHQMLDSDTPLVCNAAALSLAAFEDGYGHEYLTAMLRPVVLTAPRPGHVRTAAKNDSTIAAGEPVIRLEASGEQSDVLAPIGGKLRMEVETADIVSGGSRVAVIQPSAEQMAAALKALQKIGKSQDLHYVADVAADPVLPSHVREQAKITQQQIAERTK